MPIETKRGLIRILRSGFGFVTLVNGALDTAEVVVKSPLRDKIDNNILTELEENDQAEAAQAAARLAKTIVGPGRKRTQFDFQIKGNNYTLPEIQ